MKRITVEYNPDYQKESKEARILLDECLNLLNKIPNRKYRPKISKNTYEMASKIQQHLK